MSNKVSLNNKLSAMQGFSLVELLVVMSVIAIVSAMGFVIYREVRYQALAGRMATDMELIITAWKTWALDDTNISLPHDADYPTNQGIPECGTWYQNPPVSITAIASSSYLASIPLNPITQREYRYDNDLDPNLETNTNGGANLRLYFCNAQESATAREVAIRLDQKIDYGDGASSGRVLWRPAAGADTLTLIYSISPDSRNLFKE